MPKGSLILIYIFLTIIALTLPLKIYSGQIQSGILNSPVVAKLSSFNIPILERLLSIPLFTQERNLSCEAASIRMVLHFLGQEVKEDEIQDKFTLNPNPHKGFRGNVDGQIWGFNDYGAYAEAVADVMKKYNIPVTSYKNISTEFLKAKVLAGKPAIIWVDVANPNPKVKNIKIASESVKLISGEHTVVVKGFKDNHWIINDPWRRTTSDGTKLSEELHIDKLEDIRWDHFDNMAVIVD